jgi:ACGX-repeat protein
MNKLSFLNGWANEGKYFARSSAQSYLGANKMAFVASGCGSSCGSDDDDSKPASACGASDDNPNPSACGSGCSAGDNKQM